MQARADSKHDNGLGHNNGFGLLRLLFAGLVIVAHAPELKDGNRSRELLSLCFGSISFGDLAVDAFFVISGYLIVASFLNSSSTFAYMARRAARIYPGFLVSYLLCVLVVAPLGAVAWVTTRGQIASAVVGAILLRAPDVGAVFSGQPYPALNGAMWTIGYEFQCYVLVAMLGTAGLLRQRRVVAGLALLVTVLAIYAWYPPMPYVPTPYQSFDMFSQTGAATLLFAVFRFSPRLLAMFLIGACFYLYRDRLRFRWIYAALALAVLAVGLHVPRVADPGVALAGGYLIFFVSNRAADTPLARINNRNDVSYGLYLYGWPVQKLVYFYWPDFSPWQAGVLTFALAYGLGWASWLCVERPAMRGVRRLLKPSVPPGSDRSARLQPVCPATLSGG